MEELTQLQKDERDAMLLDRQAVLWVVDGLRKYRKLVADLLDGSSIDTFTRVNLAERIKEIEAGERWRGGEE